MSYDQTLVTCQNYLNASPVLSDSLVVELFPTLGEVSLRWKGSSPVSLPDGANLLELSFASVQTGQGAVQWDISPGICIFLDSLGSTLPAEFSPGQVRVYSIPQATITDPGPVCEGSDLLLLSHYQQGTGNGTISYQWTGPDGTGGTDPLFYLDELQTAQAGHWTLTVSDTNHCQSSSSVEVNIIPLPVSGFPADSDTLWFDEMTRLEALPGYASYRWNTGDSTSSVLVTSEGWYRVIMQTEEGCTSSDSLMMLYSFAPFTMPNAFTPDGDGKNDAFRPVTLPEKVQSFSMYIYDRWGRQVFATKDLGNGWNGIIDGKPAPMGVYTYVISYSNQAGEVRKKTGMVTLVR
ncbi:MAG: gliding motility-associated C-terminal domain-containing protein [Bacteroidales bacterium]|nr:gliding motility-associated C-terminal domain-containing protein [Bacteroidales bacterium]